MECRITDDRAGGTSHGSGNPPAFDLSAGFTAPSNSPDPRTFDELAKRVIDHGFCGDMEETAFILRHMNYETFMQYARFVGNAKSVRNVHTLFMFDQRLKSVLLRWIGVFETQFRALYANAMSLQCGPFAHRDPGNFKNEKHFEDFLTSYAREMNYKIEAGSERIRGYVKEYGDAPIWTAVEILPFGTLSKLFRNTRPKEVTHSVADSLGVRLDDLVSWMRTVSEVRNRCAHFSPLLCKPIVCRPRRIPGIDRALDSGTPFYACLIVAQLTQAQDVSGDVESFHSIGCASDLLVELVNSPSPALKAASFPDDWIEILVGQTKVVRELKLGRGDEVVKTVEFDLPKDQAK